jgi:hypothetical protein
MVDPFEDQDKYASFLSKLENFQKDVFEKGVPLERTVKDNLNQVIEATSQGKILKSIVSSIKKYFAESKDYGKLFYTKFECFK